jgi:hypothetical protein
MGVMSEKIRILELGLFAVITSGFLIFFCDVTLFQSMPFCELWWFVFLWWCSANDVARWVKRGAAVGEGRVI